MGVSEWQSTIITLCVSSVNGCIRSKNDFNKYLYIYFQHHVDPAIGVYVIDRYYISSTMLTQLLVYMWLIYTIFAAPCWPSYWCICDWYILYFQHHVDPAIGVYVIDRYTYYALEFLERVEPGSKSTMGQFVSIFSYFL